MTGRSERRESEHGRARPLFAILRSASSRATRQRVVLQQAIEVLRAMLGEEDESEPSEGEPVAAAASAVAPAAAAVAGAAPQS